MFLSNFHKEILLCWKSCLQLRTACLLLPTSLFFTLLYRYCIYSSPVMCCCTWFLWLENTGSSVLWLPVPLPPEIRAGEELVSSAGAFSATQAVPVPIYHCHWSQWKHLGEILMQFWSQTMLANPHSLLRGFTSAFQKKPPNQTIIKVKKLVLFSLEKQRTVPWLELWQFWFLLCSALTSNV